MIAKVTLLFAIVAAAHASVLLNSGLVTAPGLLNSGILAPRLMNSGLVYAPGLLNSGILAPRLLNSGLVSAPGLASPIVYSNGLIGASPYGLTNGIISPVGLRSAGILAGPGLLKTAILK